MIKVQHAAHDIEKKGVHALSTAARGHLLRLIFFCSLTRGFQFGTLDTWRAVPLPNGRALNTQGAVPIFSGHEVCLVDNVYPISRSTWHSPSVTVRCPLAPFMQNSPCEGPRRRLQRSNCAAPGAGACRACSNTVIDSVCKRIKSGEGGLVRGSGPNSAQNSSQVHVQSRY
jgi:hypothetical protein